MVVGAVKVAALSPAQQILTCGRSPVLKVEAAQLSAHWIISKSAEYSPLLLLSGRRCPPPLASVSEEPAPAAQQSDATSEESRSNAEISSPDMQGVLSSFDWGWVPAFPHAITASMANFMFGYYIGYVYTFALGAGPVTALIIPELTSTQARAKTMAVSLCVHWVCNFVIGLFFLEFVERFGLSTVYASFGVVSLLSVAFSNAFIFETKGRSLEEIEDLLNPTTE